MNSLTKKKKSKSPIQRGSTIFLICMLSVTILHGIVYDLISKFATISMMFKDRYGTGFGFYWIEWTFQQLFIPNSAVRVSMGVMFKLIAMNLFIWVPIQFIMAFFFGRKMPFEKTLRTIFYLPALIGEIVKVSVFQFMFDSSFGPLLPMVQAVIGEIPLEGVLYNKDTAFFFIMLYSTWVGLGIPTIVLTATVNKIPPELWEAARLDGITMWKELIYIVVPMCSPMLSVFFLNSLLSGFNIYTEIKLLTDPAQSNIYSFGYLIVTASMSGQYYMAAGIGFLCTIIAIPVTALVRWASDRFLPDVSV